MLRIKIEKSAFLAIGLIVFTYVLLRAINVPVCNDEAVSYLIYVRHGNFVPFVNVFVESANNHLLNSALTWVSVNVFGLNLLSLRLPNVLAMIVYLIYAYKISWILKNASLRWILFLSLTIAPHYIIEFFGYERGYGLSFACLLGTLFHLFKSIQGKHVSLNLWLSFLYINLAVLSNLGLIITYAIWLALAVILVWQASLKRGVLFISASIITFIGFSTLALHLSGLNAFYYGQETMFGTFWSVASNMLYLPSFTHLYVFLSISALGILGSFIAIFHNPIFKLTTTHIVLAMLIGNMVASLLLNWWLQTLFPSERTALHWFLFFILLLPFTATNLRYGTKVVALISAGLLFFMTYSTTLKVNLHVSGEIFWAQEQVPFAFYEAIFKKDSAEQKMHSVLAPNSFYTMNMAFKNILTPNKKTSIAQPVQGMDNNAGDFMIADTSSLNWSKSVYKLHLYDPYSKMSLLERKKPLSTVYHESREVKIGRVSDEFVKLAEFDSISMHEDSPIKIDLRLSIEGIESESRGLIFISVTDSTGNQLSYHQYDLWTFPYTEQNVVDIEFSYALDGLPENGSVINVYFWNVYKRENNSVLGEINLYAQTAK